MTSKQKHLIAIILGVELGLILFLVFSSHPVLSAWLPGTPTPLALAPPLLPTPTAPLPTEPPPSENISPAIVADPLAETLAEPTAVSAAPLLQPSPPADPAILARSYPETFAQTPPIWAHAQIPSAHEIVFFRHTFEVPAFASLPELQIFADTRYEVWLDGEWLGRGPARFSCALREYDVIPLPDLGPGQHLLAILVQWAPNARRSESNTPLLQARLQTYTPNGPVALTQTGPDWKIYTPKAWNLQAGLVHNWELIGPMEWLDFRNYPQTWFEPTYLDTTWGQATPTLLYRAAAKNPTLASRTCVHRDIKLPYTPTYQPRTIPFLVNTPLTPTLIESGFLSPNRITVQPAQTQPTATYPFNALEQVMFTVEFLTTSATANITETIQLDNLPLTWFPAGEARPDVWVGRLLITPGLHTLTNQNLKAFPIFDVFTDGLQLTPAALQQGHPGHRMLLAEPAPGTLAPTLLSGAGLNLRLDQTPAYVVLELPQIVQGRLTAEVLGPPGTLLDIGWDEKKHLGVRPLPFPGLMHPNWSQVDSWVLDGNTHTLTTLDSRTGRYLVLAVWGSGPVEIRNLRVIQETYPTFPRGTFTTPDARLNQIWQIGVDTAHVNMSDAYADPWRERGQWWGDAYIVDRTNRVAFGDVLLLQRGLRYMADGIEKGVPAAFAPSGQEVHILDYGMLWVQSLASYATLTEDQAFVSEVYPALQAFMAYLQRKTNGGLLSIPRAHWSQSTYLDTRATTSRHGQSAAVNAIYYDTLLRAATLADMVNDPLTAEKWRTQAATVKEEVNTKLYDPATGRYHATLLNGRLYAPDPFAQAWPLAYGLVPETEIPRVVTALQELLSPDPQTPNVDIYGMNWVLEGLARNGYMPETLALLERYYGYLIDAGATTWWESFLAPDRYFGTFSHGWGSSPTWILTTYLLGGQWTGPDSWQVRPALAGVSSVSGSLPIGQNELVIQWNTPSCSLAEIEIRAPSHTLGELILPFTNVTNLTLNGIPLIQAGLPLDASLSFQTDGLHLALSKRPEYRFTVEHPCP